MAEGAVLNFKRIPAEILCLDCSHQYSMSESDWTCPVCGSSKIQIVRGQEFLVESIDIEKEDDGYRE